MFGFFLMVSSVFWFFNALNKEYYTDIVIPIKFVNLPDNKLQVGNTENYIKVNISAFGYQIINYKTSTRSPISIDFKKAGTNISSDKKNKKYYYLTSQLRSEIVNIIGHNLKIIKINPDTLVIDLIKVVSKKVPVKQNLEINFRKQYMLKDSIAFFPDSVIIKGTESCLDTINAIYTKRKAIKDFHDSINFDIDLEKIKGTELIESTVNCTLQAEQYTEMEFKMPVFILNEPIGYSVKLFPSEVRVLFNVGFDSYNRITSDQFRIVTDYFELEKSKSIRALLNLNKKPNNVSNIRIYPQSVDYIIEKND